MPWGGRSACYTYRKTFCMWLLPQGVHIFKKKHALYLLCTMICTASQVFIWDVREESTGLTHMLFTNGYSLATCRGPAWENGWCPFKQQVPSSWGLTMIDRIDNNPQPPKCTIDELYKVASGSGSLSLSSTTCPTLWTWDSFKPAGTVGLILGRSSQSLQGRQE